MLIYAKYPKAHSNYNTGKTAGCRPAALQPYDEKGWTGNDMRKTKWTLALIALLLAVLPPTAYAAEEDEWQNIFTSSFPIAFTDEGAVLSYSGDYAMGYSRIAPVKFHGYQAVVSLKDIPAWDSSTNNVWYAVGLESPEILTDDETTRKGWIFENVGVFVLIIPKSEHEVELNVRFRRPDQRGLVGPAKNIKLAARPKEDPFTVIFGRDSIWAGGTNIPLNGDDLAAVFDAIGEKAIPTFGLFTQTPNSNPSTLIVHSIEEGVPVPDVPAQEPAGTAEVSATSQPANGGDSNASDAAASDSQAASASPPAPSSPAPAAGPGLWITLAAAVVLAAGGVFGFLKFRARG